MQKPNKIWNNIITIILCVVLILGIYFTSEITINGVALPRHEAGILAIIIWTILIALGGLGAYILHLIIKTILKLIDWIYKKL